MQCGSFLMRDTYIPWMLDGLSLVEREIFLDCNYCFTVAVRAMMERAHIVMSGPR